MELVIPNMQSTITDIAYSLITTYKTIDYFNGKYGDFEVVIRKDNGYINVTKILSKYKKDITHWKRIKASNIALEKVSSHLGCTEDDLSIEVHGGGNSNTDITGTYYHPLLIPQIIMWAKPEFIIEVSTIVNEFMGRKALETLRHEKDAVIEKHKSTIDKHESTIDDLKQMVAQQSRDLTQFREKTDRQFKASFKKQEETIQYAQDLKKQNIKTHKKLDFTTDQNTKLIDKVQKVNTCIKKISENQVIPTEKANCRHMFLVVAHNPNATRPFRKYEVIRRQQRSVAKRLTEIKEKHSDAKVLLKFAAPNPITFWNTIKEDSVNRDRFTCTPKSNVITIHKDCTINWLLGIIKTAHNRRLEYGEVLPLEVFEEVTVTMILMMTLMMLVMSNQKAVSTKMVTTASQKHLDVNFQVLAVGVELPSQ